MPMDENLRFIALIDGLKAKGQVADYVQLAATLGTNKAGISDIKAGRKKISIDLLRRMKLSYPCANIEWVIMGEGPMFIQEIKEQEPTHTTPTYLLEMIANKDASIVEQAKEIGRLEQQIKDLEQRLEKTAGDANIGNTANVG